MAMDGLQVSAIWDAELLKMLLLAAGFGLVGGVGRVARASSEARPRAATIAGTLLVAAIAAVGALFVFDPGTPLKFASACVVAGYAGAAILDALEARFRLLAAESKAERARAVGELAVAKAEEAIDLARFPPAPTANGGAAALEELRSGVRSLRAELQAMRQHDHRP